MNPCHTRKQRNLLASLLLIALLFGFVDLPQVQAAGSWFVAPNGDDANDCRSAANACKTIGAAVAKANPGDTVNVAAGVYAEQVTISKNITLLGDQRNSVIQATSNMPSCFSTYPNENRPVVCVRDAANVTLSGFTIDGLGLGNTNNRFYGIAYRNAGGTIQNNLVENIRNTPFDGAQHGVGIYVSNDDTTARTIHILDNTVSGFQKNGIDLSTGISTNPLTIDIQRNTITGYGATKLIAQNGIQIQALAGSGTIADNTISGIAYDNSNDLIKSVATSILIYWADLNTTGNTIRDAHMGIYYYDGNGLIADNDLEIEKVGIYAYGILAADPPQAVPAPYDAPENITGSDTITIASLTSVEVRGNQVAFTGADNTTTYGIEADAGYGMNNLSVDVHHNTVSGFAYGVMFYQCESGCFTSVFEGISAVSNNLTGNSVGIYFGGPIPEGISPAVHHNRIQGDASQDKGLVNNLSRTVTAENNWWGCNSGPADAKCLGVTGAVDADPRLVMSLTANQHQLTPGGAVHLTTWLNRNSDGADTSAQGTVMDGIPLTYTTTEGTLDLTSGGLVNGSAGFTFTAPDPITALFTTISATLDHQTAFFILAQGDLLQVSPWSDPVTLPNLSGSNPTVVFDGTNYHIWYTDNGVLYHASSPTPDFAGATANPVTGLGSSCQNPTVGLENGVFYMINTNPAAAGDPMFEKAFHIYTSTDGTQWVNKGLVVDTTVLPALSAPFTWEKIGAPSLLFDNDGYKLYFQATMKDASLPEGSNLSTAIYLGTTTESLASIADGNDDIDFTVLATPVLTPTPGTWDDGFVGHPVVVKDGDTYYMWYTGGSGELLGFATSSDGITWTKGAGNPVLSGSVGEPSIIVVGDTWYLWVETEDSGFQLITSPAPFQFPSIQSAIDAAQAGDIVNVAAGTYTEQVTISNDIALVGDPQNTVLQASDAMPPCFTTDLGEIHSIVCVENTTGAVINGLTIDGLNSGATNTGFTGVALNNAGGTIQNNIIQNIGGSSAGTPQGVGIYASNDDATARTIHVLDNTISDFQQAGIVLSTGSTENPLTVDVQRNTITGSGATDSVVQNGIQIQAWGGSGVVADNTITGIAYDNTNSSIPYVAASILNLGADLEITGNTISGAQMGIYSIDGSGLIANNDLSIEKVGVSAYGIQVGYTPQAEPFPVGTAENPATIGILNTVEITGNTVIFNGADNTATYGIEADAGYEIDDLAITVHHNTVRGFGEGLAFYQCADGCKTGVFRSISAYSNDLTDNTIGIYFGGLIPTDASPIIHHNRIYGDVSTDKGLKNDLSWSVTAENNWWGCNGGPADAACVGITGTVDADPWLVMNLTADLHRLTPGGVVHLTTWLNRNSDGADTSAQGTMVDGIPLTYTTTEGTLDPVSGGLTDGSAGFTFTAPDPLTAATIRVSAALDHQVANILFINGGYSVYLPLIMK